MTGARSPFAVDGNVCIVVLDSVPWESFRRASASFLRSADELRPGYTCANWTVPSLRSMRTGILPAGPDRSEARQLFAKARTDRAFDWPNMAQAAGYFTACVISLENATTGEGFEHFAYVRWAEDILAHVGDLKLGQRGAPWALFVQFQEAHMPYARPGDPSDHYPTPAAVNAYNAGNSSALSPETLDYLRARQVRQVEYLDGVCRRLHAQLPPCHMVVTADHGDLFGEVPAGATTGRFGHTYWHHENLFRVPYTYRRPKPVVRGRKGGKGATP